MRMKHSAGARRCFSAFVTSVAFSGSLAVADTVELDPAAFGSAWDDGPSKYEMPDGRFEAMQPPGEPLLVWKTISDSGFFREYRTRYEFALPPELQQLGVSINRATLALPIVQGSHVNADHGLLLNASPADDTLTLEDFGEWYPIAGLPVNSGLADFHHRFEVADYLLSLTGGGHQRVGFAGAIFAWSAPITWTHEAKLKIEYSPASPTLPGLSVLWPWHGEQHVDGTPIRLYAKASDPQDGHIDASIQWEVSTEGSIVWQGTDSDHIMLLPVGDYQITAAVTDSDGNTVTHTRNVAILTNLDNNLPPTLSIVSPAEGMDLLAGIPTPLQATAMDPEDGDVSSSIVWSLNGDVLGNGASISATLPLGSHTLKAIAHDNSGHAATKEINVNVLPDRSYCAAGGAWANPSHYITAVALNGTAKQSGSNGGYTDFTGTWLPAVKGANSLSLQSAGGQPVYWTVWIDLNRNGEFTANEALNGFRATGTTNRTMTIPGTAVTGLTRMRVSMLYDRWPEACRVGYVGETEDYTIVIQ